MKIVFRNEILFQVFDMDALELVWEQELYNEIDYKRKEPLFHCFEGDTAFIGLSFMDDIESNHFNEKVC